MTATKYTYSIQNDFPNHAVASDRLKQEIQASAIVTALDYINTSGDDCDIWFKDALSGGDQTVLNGLVAVHSGEPLPQDGPIYSPKGGMLTSATYSDYSDDEGFDGVLVQAGAGAVTIEDFHITTEVNAAGGFFWSKGGNLGDFVEVSVVDKDDVLGLFATYGLTVGVDVLELGKWVQHLYINPDGIPWAELIADDVAPVYAGLYLRAKYDNQGVEPAVVGITYKMFHVGA